jgi:hypothetical protein
VHVLTVLCDDCGAHYETTAPDAVVRRIRRCMLCGGVLALSEQRLAVWSEIAGNRPPLPVILGR